MSTVDYDAPRSTAGAEPDNNNGLDLLQQHRGTVAGLYFGESYELAGLDVDDDGLTAPVVPIRGDEFRCYSCFLVLHNSLHAGRRNSHDLCRDCA